MTEAQQQVLREQVVKRERARQDYEAENARLRDMLVMFDARFADADSGVEFDLSTMTVKEPTAPQSTDS